MYQMIGFVGTVFPAMVKRIFKVNRRSFGRTRIRRNIDLFIGFVRVADIFYGFINGCFEIQREYLYETGVHIEKNKLGNTWWQKQAHVSYARMCVMDTYASV